MISETASPVAESGPSLAIAYNHMKLKTVFDRLQWHFVGIFRYSSRAKCAEMTRGFECRVHFIVP